ncbi:MAG: carbohydrate kinase [Chloroflexota bacterium]|nr:MAG: carbohydrate kinase [Chloroflexota bacterium]
MSKPYVLGIDQGTSGTKAVIIGREGEVLGYAYRPVARIYPQPGWVEQDPLAVVAGVEEAITEAIGQAGIQPGEIAACGLACQRNTDFAWDARSGQPIGNAITWQDSRSLPFLEEIKRWPLASEVHTRLGYGPGPYMSALHLAWRERYDLAYQETSRSGHLKLGLSAAWLLRTLGHPTGHYLDSSLVQAMGFYDFRASQYWAEWLDLLDVQPDALPEAMPTLFDYGALHVTGPGGATADVPVLAMIGDQQAALFGHNCRQPGEAECTHGTASYVKVFLGHDTPDLGKMDVLCAWRLDDRQTYCLEAPTTVIGAVIRWMRDEVQLVRDYGELESLATSVPDPGGLYFVPAFTGLNAPYGDPNARGTLFGLTLGHTRGHIIRAFLEALGYQLRDILASVWAETGIEVNELLVGGGVSASDLACQIQADLLGIPVKRPDFSETTAWAAGLLAGLGAGTWTDVTELPPLPGDYTHFYPQLTPGRRDANYERWRHAVALTQNWGNER